MSDTELTQTTAPTQAPPFPSYDHAQAWALYIQRRLSETLDALKKPQTRHDHARLSEDKARYSKHVARFKAAGVL